MTDEQFLLSVLSDGQEHSLNEILVRSFEERGCGLTVHSRAADLRAKGYNVVNTHVPGRQRGYGSAYRLVGRLEAGPRGALTALGGGPASSEPRVVPTVPTAAMPGSSTSLTERDEPRGTDNHGQTWHPVKTSKGSASRSVSEVPVGSSPPTGGRRGSRSRRRHSLAP